MKIRLGLTRVNVILEYAFIITKTKISSSRVSSCKSYLSLEMNSDCDVNRDRFSIQALLRCKIMLTIIKKGSGQDCPN